MIFHNFQTLRHILDLQVGPNHDLKYFLNFLKDVFFFTSSASAIHIFDPRAMETFATVRFNIAIFN